MVPTAELVCPNRDTWSGFYAGRTPPAALPGLADHLDHCARCREVLDALQALGADAPKGEADVIVTGEGFSEVAGRVAGLVSVRARVEITAVDRKTGRVLAADRQTALVVDASEQIAGKTALQNAAADIAERLLPKLVTPEKK